VICFARRAKKTAVSPVREDGGRVLGRSGLARRGQHAPEFSLAALDSAR
jgi:hypothetical protein